MIQILLVKDQYHQMGHPIVFMACAMCYQSSYMKQYLILWKFSNLNAVA